MSTFYLLPPRPVLGERFARYLSQLFPGLEWSSACWSDLADVLGAAAGQHADVFVVYRDEIPDGEDIARGLKEGFGAEADDEVVEIQAGQRPGEVSVRRWRCGAVDRGSAAAAA
jgi:hypothetical protein